MKQGLHTEELKCKVVGAASPVLFGQAEVKRARVAYRNGRRPRPASMGKYEDPMVTKLNDTRKLINSWLAKA